jgi:hypothetical protein
VVVFYGVVWDPVCIVSEYLEKGSLLDFMYEKDPWTWEVGFFFGVFSFIFFMVWREKGVLWTFMEERRSCGPWNVS